MTAYLFPGQGSQTLGMGAGLFDRFPELVAEADALLGYSIAELCLSDPERRLKHTQYTQPALYVVGCLHYLALVEERRYRPDCLAGHSVGEYPALFAAGAFDFTTGLMLVHERGRIMASAREGTMAAVLGLKAADVERVIADLGTSEVVIGTYNAPSQVVVSGAIDDIARAEPLFVAAGARFVRLDVSGAFHSPLMAPGRKEFEDVLARVAFDDPAIPVLSNLDGRPHTAARMRETLAGLLTGPVQWVRVVEAMLARGESELEEMIAPNVLTKLTQKIREDIAKKDRPTLASVAES
jgi:trans-AT polyketide synthase/acyltransferase/oxidoreductase domain-containing protein